MEAKITRVIDRLTTSTIVEVVVTVRTIIREGRSVPDMVFDGPVVNKHHNVAVHAVNDDRFILAVHEAINEDPIVAAEMKRICD